MQSLMVLARTTTTYTSLSSRSCSRTMAILMRYGLTAPAARDLMGRCRSMTGSESSIPSISCSPMPSVRSWVRIFAGSVMRAVSVARRSGVPPSSHRTPTLRVTVSTRRSTSTLCQPISAVEICLLRPAHSTGILVRWTCRSVRDGSGTRRRVRSHSSSCRISICSL